METCTIWRSVLLVNPGGGGRFLVSVNCGDAPHVPTQWSPGSGVATAGRAQKKFAARTKSVSTIEAARGVFFFVEKCLVVLGFNKNKKVGLTRVWLIV